MRYCPQCLDEFADFEKLCPDCGAGLVYRSLPPDAEDSPARLVTIATFEDESEAALCRSALAAEGIWSCTSDVIKDSPAPVSPGFSKLVLQVSAANANSALRLLQRLWSGPPSP